jgi:hypothetical protein
MKVTLPRHSGVALVLALITAPAGLTDDTCVGCNDQSTFPLLYNFAVYTEYEENNETITEFAVLAVQMAKDGFQEDCVGASVCTGKCCTYDIRTTYAGSIDTAFDNAGVTTELAQDCDPETWENLIGSGTPPVPGDLGGFDTAGQGAQILFNEDCTLRCGNSDCLNLRMTLDLTGVQGDLTWVEGTTPIDLEAQLDCSPCAKPAPPGGQ